MEKYKNHLNQTFITFKFLDFNKFSYYDYIKLAYPTKLDTIKITSETIKVKVNDYSSFSFLFNFTLSNSVTKRISRQFDFEIYTNRDNMIYLFLNDEFNYYQVELFAQISPPKEVLSLQTKIRVNNKDFLILINCIDIYHSKFVCHLYNFPLNFQFISPEVNFLVDEADLKNHNKYKMCLYYLKNSKFHITCHAIDYELNSTKLSKRIASMNEDKVLEFIRDLKEKLEEKLEQYKDNKYEQSKEDLMKEIENIYKGELLMNKERECIFMTFAEISIKSIKKWNSKLYEIFSNVYYLSLFFAHSNKWKITEEEEESDEDGDDSDNSTENKRLAQLERIYNKFYEFVTKREELLMSIKDDNYENKLLKESLFISSFSLYINSKETEEETYYLPQLVELSDLGKTNFYYAAFSFLHKIIDNLDNTSYLVEPLMLLNSNISEDINLLNEDRKEKQFEICIIDINSMKAEIQHFIPTSFYRWYSSSKVRAFYQPRGNFLVINEKLLFNRSKRKVDSSFIKGGGLKTTRLTTSLVFLLLHELLGHKKLTAKNFSVNSPEKVLFNGQFVSGGEAGEYIEKYISSSEKLNFIKSPMYVRPFSIIKDTSLFTQKTNEALNQKIDDLIEENDKTINEKRKNTMVIKSDQKKERYKSHNKFHYLLGDRLFTKMTIGIPQF